MRVAPAITVLLAFLHSAVFFCMTHIINFKVPRTFDDVALCLGLQSKQLELALKASANACSERKYEMIGDLVCIVVGNISVYEAHRIPKRSGKAGQYRLIWEVNNREIRDAHRAFAVSFGNFAHNEFPAFPHRAAYGYIRGIGIKQNAAKHCGQPHLLKADIENFFPSITKERLKALFIELGIPDFTADILSSFTTIEKRLALGLNASPLLANLICHELDEGLQKLADEGGCIYTRYADDISISGQSLPKYEEVSRIVSSNGFSLSNKKYRTTKPGQAHFVTGLSVSDPNGPHVPKAYKRRLRQELYYCKKYGIYNHLDWIGSAPQRGINRIDGTVRYVASIESRNSEQLRESWKSLLRENGASTSYASREEGQTVSTIFLIDETSIVVNGKEILMVACVETPDIEFLNKVTTHVLQKHVADPFSTGKKDVLQKIGLHFADSSIELRNQYITMLGMLPLRGYIAYGGLESNNDYQTRYLDLLKKILPRRLKGADHSVVSMFIEQNPRVQTSALVQSINNVFAQLEAKGDRRPVGPPEVKIISKDELPAIAVPDYFLGVFRKHFEQGEEIKPFELLWFERLRSRFRHIVNIDTKEFYSRRHPLDYRNQAKKV